jgi:threonine dehydratase
VVTASGGNFGAAIAFVAQQLGIPASVVVMTGSTLLARGRIASYGAELHVIGEHWDLSWDAGRKIAEERGGALLHPFADPPVIAGQGTIGLEILEDMPDVDTVVVAIGGGGLIGGISEAIKQRKPSTRIVGVETEGCPTLYAARQAGRIVKIEDFTTNVPILAARTTEPINFEMIQRCVDELVLVSEDEPKPAAEWMWRNTGLAVELGAATAVSAVLNGHVATKPGERVVVVLCAAGNDGLATASVPGSASSRAGS